MWKNRLCYFIVLISVLLFFFCYNGYISLYVLRLVAALPFFSLLVSLPGMLGTRVEMAVGRPAVRKGGEISLRITARNRMPFAGGRASLRFTARNTLTGETQKERFFFTAGRAPLVISHKLSSPACGQVALTLSKGWVCDYMGLFSLPVRLPKPSEWTVLFYPAVYCPALAVEQTAMPDGEGERYSQTKAGDDPSELFAFREYREGDRISRIHWKLSQKMGELQVKELGLPISDHILFLLEINGSGREADALLDVFATLSNFLSEREVAHRVSLAGRDGDELSLWEITQAEDALPVLDALLLAAGKPSAPPLLPESLPAGTAHILYLCCQPDPEIPRQLHLCQPSARVSVLTVSEDAEAQNVLPEGTEILRIQPGHVPEALDGFIL